VLPEWLAAYETFLAEPGRWDFLVPWARASLCLPLFCGWTHAYGVTEGGDVLVFEVEPWPGIKGPPTGPNGEVTDVRCVNGALHEGAKRYPWLKEIFPPRPSDAQDCSMCQGTGKVPEPAICYCGGAGWVPADDTWLNKERFARR
jgi:hypothetical protein